MICFSLAFKCSKQTSSPACFFFGAKTYSHTNSAHFSAVRLSALLEWHSSCDLVRDNHLSVGRGRSWGLTWFLWLSINTTSTKSVRFLLLQNNQTKPSCPFFNKSRVVRPAVDQAGGIVRAGPTKKMTQRSEMKVAMQNRDNRKKVRVLGLLKRDSLR